MSDQVRYLVKATCFVNDCRVRHVPGKTTYVWARPGLQGAALELAPEKSKAAAAASASQPDRLHAPDAEGRHQKAPGKTA